MFIFNSHKTIDILEQLIPENPIIVEAGAFDGNDSRKMAQRWPQGVIHAFEPVPEIFTRLEKNTQKYSNIIRYPYALSNCHGWQPFYISEKPARPGVASQAGSLHKPKDRLRVSPLIFPRTISVKTLTLVEWAEQYSVNHIDLLWLDTQGHELTILEAAVPILPQIRFILAEVSFIESYYNQPLYQDVVQWLAKHGYRHIGCDFSDKKKSFFGNALFTQAFL
jgi:FkbM family methyltransferase